MANIGIVYDPIFIDHRNPFGHPERIERLQSVMTALERTRLLTRLAQVPALPAERADVERVHTLAYLEELEVWRGREGNLDPDTYVSEQSVEAAYKAAGGGIELVNRVWKGRLSGGFALLRPPGHHAEADRAMGFCLLNNIAIAAAHLHAAGVGRVAIVDWDVHHGNGTQHMFAGEGDILFISTHQAPFYPGTGAASEVGRGAGEGRTVNLPFPEGFGDPDYLTAFDTIILPILAQFGPDIILVSAGFDSYFEDPLASMRVTAEGFAGMAARLRTAAERLCGGKIVYFLEGGYDLGGLSQGVVNVLVDLLDRPPVKPVEGKLSPAWEATRDRITAVQSRYWTI